MITFLIAVFIVAVISGLASIAAMVALLLGHPFFVGFGLAFIGLWVIGWMWTTLSNKLSLPKYKTLATLEEIKHLSSILQVSCAYCSTPQPVNVRLGHENTFKCVNCNNLNRLQIEYAAIRTSEPLPIDQVTEEVFSKLGSIK
jgi:hypothetical protein